MRNKFKYLTLYSLKKKIDTKWFKVVNVLLCLLLVFMFNMDSIIKAFGGDFDKKNKIYVVDNVGKYNSFKNNMEAIYKEIEEKEIEIILDNKALDKKDKIDDDIIIVINKSDTDYITSEIVSYDAVPRTTYEIVNSSLNSLKTEIVLETSGLSADEISKLTSPVKAVETVLNKDAQDNATKEMLSGVITTIFIVPFFILIVSMVQMLGAEINDEKSSRGMEIIISSVSAKEHFLSKILASLSFVLIQGGLLFLYGILAFIIKEIISVSGVSAGVGGIISEVYTMVKASGVFILLFKGAIPLLVLFVVSFILYAIVAATLASMTTNIEDFQQLQTPLMIIMMVGYYIAIMAVMFDGSIFINILAYIPMLSVLIAPTLYLMGGMSLISLIGSVLVTCIATFIIYKYALRIYKVGILNYSSSKLWGKMFKSIKKGA